MVDFESKSQVWQVQGVVHRRFMVSLMRWVVKILIILTLTLKSILPLVVMGTGFLVKI